MIRHALLFVLLTLPLGMLAQQTYTLSGHVQDGSSGEQLIGATVWCEDAAVGVAANNYGFYSLTLPAGTHTFAVSFIGYSLQRFEIDLTENVRMDANLVMGVELGVAEVNAEAQNRIEDRVQMSKMEIPIDQIKRLPAIGGEVDLLKVLQLMPGVQSGGEGSSGIYVRGGSPDQNLILLDGVPLYSVSHLFGFFSVFNADAVKTMSITKGGYPARFGGRLSSVLEINLKDGHMREYHADATVSLIASKLTVEGPIVKDKASFMISGRRTYLDIIAAPLIAAANSEDSNISVRPRYYFWDVNAKLNWKIGDHDRVYFSAFSGKDDFGVRSDETYGSTSSSIDLGLDWGNQVQALRWNHEWGPQMFSNATLTRSKYRFNTGIELSESDANDPEQHEEFKAVYFSGIEDYAAKIDFDYVPNAANFIRYGANVTRHKFSPGATQFEVSFGTEEPLDTIYGSQDVYSTEAFLYIEDEVSVNERLQANLGLHGSMLFVEGVTYPSLQPRVGLNFGLTPKVALKASFAKMTQFVNLLTNEGVGLPTDLWVPSTARIKPQKSWQVALGLARTVGDFELSLEGYYKDMKNLLSYREGANFLFGSNDGWENEVEQGTGNSYGLECLVQRKVGKTVGWIGYTLSWTNRQFDYINSGNPFPYTYDRRHDVSIVLTQEITEKWTASAVWVYGTGRALTLSESSYYAYVPDEVIGWGSDVVVPIEVPSEKNAFRTSAYHRLDLSLTRRKEKDNHTRELIFSTYNTYNNLNPFFVLPDNDGQGNPVLREYGLFPMIPSVAWRAYF